MPDLNFDTISMAHGSGGKMTEILLKSGVFSLLGNEWLDQRGDGAVFSLPGRIAMSTDSFVISPIFFPGGNIGDLAVNGTVNDLAMCGALPRFMSLSFILEEGLDMKEFWNILSSIRNACAYANVQVITGDTKVVERGKGDRIFINTTGLGQVHPAAKLGASFIKPGDRILISGPFARHGMTIMSLRQGLEFDSNLESDTRPLHLVCHSLLEQFSESIHFFRDPTRGGVASVLNEIATQANCGVQLQERELPLDEDAAGACEMLGLDPLYVANEGIFLAVVSSKKAEACLELLRGWEHGKKAAIIGEITSEHPGSVVLQSAFGGRRLLPLLSVEQLPRIC